MSHGPPRPEHDPCGARGRLLRPGPAGRLSDDPAPLPQRARAARIGLDGLSDAEWIRHFGRFEPLPGNFPEPLALRYHGHQFRVYNPDLGDGRGFLFAQLRDLDDGRLLDLGTKGSGRRRGRAAATAG